MTNIKTLSYVFCGLGLVATLLIFTLSSVSDLAGLLTPYTLWIVLPYLFTLPLIRYTHNSVTEKIVLLLSLALFLSSTYAYTETLNSSDPQAGMIYLFLPLYQLITVATSLTIIAVLKFINK